MTGSSDSERASTSTLQAVQHAVGVNFIDVATWIGPVVGAAWLWTGSRAPVNSLLPAESPLQWFGRLADSLFGLHFGWATDAHWWLHDHRYVSVVLISTAIYSSTRRRSSGATFLALLLAISVLGPFPTVAWYLGASLALCCVAMALDFKETMPGISLSRWFSDCVGPIVVWALAPIALAGEVVQRFRVTPETEYVFGFELTRKLKQLPDLPLSDVKVRDLTNVLAHVLLLAHDDERRRSALFSINRLEIEDPGDSQGQVRGSARDPLLAASRSRRFVAGR